MSTGNSPRSHSPASEDSEYEPTLNGLIPLPQQLSSDSRFSTGDSPNPSSSFDNDVSDDSDHYEPPTEIAMDTPMDITVPIPTSAAGAMPVFEFSSPEVELLCIGKIDSVIDHPKPKIKPKDYREWREGFVQAGSQREILLYAAHQITGLRAQFSNPKGNDGGDYDTLKKAESFTTGMPLTELPWAAVTEDAVSRMSGMVVLSGIVQACFALNYLACQMASSSSGNAARRAVASTLPLCEADDDEVRLKDSKLSDGDVEMGG